MTGPPEQLTQADLDRLLACRDYSQIERHRAEGRLAALTVPQTPTQPPQGAHDAQDT